VFSRVQVSVYLSLWLASFFLVNIRNVVEGRKPRACKVTYAEVERSLGLDVVVAALGTVLFFLETALYALSGLLDLPFFESTFLTGGIGYTVQICGLALMGLGFSLFIWSVLNRGQYSVSWGMAEDHRLITTGPYALVRHPSYLGYFLMFLGFLFTVQSIAALVPLAAILGYVSVVKIEEEMLLMRFGDDYVEYTERTGRFIPKRRE
jgi:protein-S-isoprenylcysteine O-methyltransferase Ste14